MGRSGLDPIYSKGGVRGSHGGGCGELGNRNVIGMSVSALRSECHDDLGLDSSNMLDNAGNRFARIGAIEMLVREIKQRDFPDT